jgi:hypothetical protein
MSTQQRRRWVVFLVAIASFGPSAPLRPLSGQATAGESSEQSSEQFRTPSNNIHCLLFDDSLRCMVLDYVGKEPRKPADCDLDWGAGATLEVRGRASLFVCAGDTIQDNEAPLLAYGTSKKYGSFRCASALAGLTCVNRSNRGFFLSRKSIRQV